MEALLRHKIILIVIALIVAGAVWYGLSPSATSPVLTDTPSSDASSADEGIVPILLTLRAVKLDGTIFSDPAFKQLQDFSTEIVPEPIGRTNPFAPLSSQTSSAPSTQNPNPASH